MIADSKHLAVVLLLVWTTSYYTAGETFIITSSSNSFCPGEQTEQPSVCFTLQQYFMSNWPRQRINVTLELQPGNHYLNSRVSVSNILSYTFKGTNATVYCNWSKIDTISDMYFFRGYSLYIEGITFSHCNRIHSNSVERFVFKNSGMNGGQVRVNRAITTISKSSFSGNRQGVVNRGFDLLDLSRCEEALIQQCMFYNSEESGIHGYELQRFTVRESTFKNNSGSGITTQFSTTTISSSSFTDNKAGHGGAIFLDGGNIRVIDSVFINNTARRGGGAIFSRRERARIVIYNTTFNNNSALFCGVLDVNGRTSNHEINFTGSTFLYNRAAGEGDDYNGGGVLCVKNALLVIEKSNFSHNMATKYAGVFDVEGSEVVIQRSVFNNNTAERKGGVFYTLTNNLPTRYNIRQVSFTNNQAGEDGGVMSVNSQRASIWVQINDSILAFNSASDEGGVANIIGTTLEISNTIIINNSANMGDVISAIRSNVTVPSELSTVKHSYATYYYSGDVTEVNQTITPGLPIVTVMEANTTISPTETNASMTDSQTDKSPTINLSTTVETSIMTYTVNSSTRSQPSPLAGANPTTTILLHNIHISPTETYAATSSLTETTSSPTSASITMATIGVVNVVTTSLSKPTSEPISHVTTSSRDDLDTFINEDNTHNGAMKQEHQPIVPVIIFCITIIYI